LWDNNELEELNLTDLEKLVDLHISTCNNLKKVNILNLPKLIRFCLYENENLEEINLSNLPNLEMLRIGDSKIKSLILPDALYLKELILSDNKNLQTVILPLSIKETIEVKDFDMEKIYWL